MLALSSHETVRRPRANSVDVSVGQRIRMRRQQMRVSQMKLAEAIGVTFQQVQKYEKGSNRVSASKLYDIALALQVPVSFFFDEPVSAEQREFITLSAMPDGLDLLRAFAGVRDEHTRHQIIGICNTVANGQASH